MRGEKKFMYCPVDYINWAIAAACICNEYRTEYDSKKFRKESRILRCVTRLSTLMLRGIRDGTILWPIHESIHARRVYRRTFIGSRARGRIRSDSRESPENFVAHWSDASHLYSSLPEEEKKYRIIKLRINKANSHARTAANHERLYVRLNCTRF